MDSDIPFREGDVLVEKYRLERLLGTGGMGVVFEATQLELDRRVAIKLLRPDVGVSDAAVARVLVEARATARLENTHVTKLLDVGRLDGGAPFLVMELLRGNNLSELLAAEGPRNVGLAVKYLLETCEALAEAHSAGIVHRDLKPANLFLARDNLGRTYIKVLDFGISKIVDPTWDKAMALTDSRALIGSPAYMSPEQMRSAREVDQRTDVWSLGAVLFELLSGRPVWSGQSLSDLCAQVTRDPCPTLTDACPGIAPELSRVVARCLEKDPVNRYQDVADLALALQPFANSEDRAIVARVLKLAGRSTPAAEQTTQPPDPARPLSPSNAGRTLEASVVTASKTKPRLMAGPIVLVGIVALGGTAYGLFVNRGAPSATTAVSNDPTTQSVSRRAFTHAQAAGSEVGSSSPEMLDAGIPAARAAASTDASTHTGRSTQPTPNLERQRTSKSGSARGSQSQSTKVLVDPMSIRE